jgi:C-terminal processing protease CtpA/Prc
MVGEYGGGRRGSRAGRAHQLHVRPPRAVAGSPAAEAGVRRGDIVVSVDGRHVVTATGALVDVFVISRELAD